MPSPTVLSLPSVFSDLVAVIQACRWWGSCATTTACAPCLSHPPLGSVSPGQFKVIPSQVATSIPVHSPICRANAVMTSFLARRWLNEVATSIWISGLRPRSWFLMLSLAAYKTFDATPIVISGISSTPLALSDRREVNQRRTRSMTGLRLWTNGNLSTRPYDRVAVTITSNS